MSALTERSQESVLTATTVDPQDVTHAAQDAVTDLPLAAGASALDFLNSIEEGDFEQLLYADHLVIVSGAGAELGTFSVTVEPASHDDTDCFLVHANSHGAIDDVPCGTSITAWVDYKLNTLKQEHHEYVKLENEPLDRRTYLERDAGQYVVTRVVTQRGDVTRSARTLAADVMTGFISEGSNLLLQRLLAVKGLPTEQGVPSDLVLLAFDADTNLCPAVYRALPADTQVVQATEVDVVGLERTIHADPPTTWRVYCLADGHLTSREQVGAPVTMRLLTLPPTELADEEPQPPTFGKRPLDWQTDMQMYSGFLDRKAELSSEHNVYLRHHPELRALLADFLQFLFLRKPSDVIAFAADYFAAFSVTMANPSTYKHSGEPSPHADTKASPRIQHLAQLR